MSGETDGIKTPIPRKEIDWCIVDEMIEMGCLGTEIASTIGIHPDTLYLRCVQERRDEHGKPYPTYTAYSQQKGAKGEATLRMAQFKKAAEGDNSMLIWLGKQRLGQKDRNDITTNEKDFPSPILSQLNTNENKGTDIQI